MSNDREDRDNEGLDPATLSAWQAEEPPVDFADRVMSARAQAAQTPRPAAPRAARSAPLALAYTVVAVAAIVTLILWPRPPASRAPQTRVVGERTSIALDGRGVAVAEAGSRISWSITDGAARVEQSAGDVFYRVDRGGPFVVATPAGTITVLGTCFRVEVTPVRPSKSAILTVVTSAGVGAALTAAVLVTVYEGRVVLANENGETRLAAGEQGSMRAGAPPTAGALDPKAIAAATDPAPSGSATREELLARDKVQRDELAKLRVKVRELEGQIAAAAGGGGRGKHGDFPFVDPTPDELLAMARECRIQWDSPPMELDPDVIGADRAQRMGITEEERVALNKAFLTASEKIIDQLRALYVEVTGDAAGAETLSAHALQQEIENKSDKRDKGEAMWRISQERAGLLAPPPDLASRPAVERMLRLMITVGDFYEKELARVLGPERARELRMKDDGWGSKSAWSGCPEDKKAPGAGEE